ncbi:MAG TPA: triphosphoribosyl-dephospho-CoA synthase MdcB [Telluria sp.]|nr:triphosphoribosyl-dephospho-CoA synthase MdcB [Telluria sp.]
MQAFAAAVARSAVSSLYAELVLYPKPGLVSLVDNGSHTDMNAGTFFRSMFALRRYFALICQAGIDGAPFDRLKQLGIDAEARMLRATNGINTHRGAIFSLGMLCAASGRVAADGLPPAAATLRAELLANWGDGLGAHTQADGVLSNGLRVAKEHGANGAREEGALGFPSVFEVGLPVLQAALDAGRGVQRARIDTLFALMAHMSDTNVYHRAGSAGAGMVRAHAQAFIDAGGTSNPGWYAMAVECHRLFVAHRISPGGAADLLAATCLVHALTECGQ